ERVADGGTDREIRERRRLRQRSQELCAVLLTADAGRSIDLRPTPASSRTHELLLLFERPLGGCEPAVVRECSIDDVVERVRLEEVPPLCRRARAEQQLLPIRRIRICSGLRRDVLVGLRWIGTLEIRADRAGGERGSDDSESQKFR